MGRAEHDRDGVAVDGAAAADALRILLDRAHHELATPLLTASGFSRIALDLLDGTLFDGAARAELTETLTRVVDGVERARTTLAAVAALAEDPGYDRIDLAEVLADGADAVVARGTPVELVVAPPTIGCHGVRATMHELVVLLLELFAHDGGGRDGTTTVEVDAGSPAGASSVVVTLQADGDPWSAAAVAASEAPPASASPSPVDAAPSAGATQAEIAVRVAVLGRALLGRVWLDPDPPPGRRIVTLRLLAGRSSAPHPSAPHPSEPDDEDAR